MALSNSSREKLSWLFLESGLIVVSILLAFWIDTWWDDLQQAGQERELLSAIRSDLVRNQQQLISIIDERELGSNSLRTFFRLTPDELLSLPSDRASQILQQLNIGRTFNAYDIAIKSDDLALIRDSEIRRRLGVWIGIANDVSEDSPVIIERGRDVFESMDLYTLAALMQYEFAHDGPTANEQLRGLRDNQYFLKARLIRQRTIDVNNRKAKKLLEQTEGLLELIES